MRLPTLCLILLPLMTGACQAGPGGTPSTRSSSNHITPEEIASLEGNVVMTARQVIHRLRPSWLRPRSSTARGRHTPVVFQDGVQLGGLETLDDMDMRHIMEFRYLSASDATNRYGTGYPGGIIQVFTRRN